MSILLFVILSVIVLVAGYRLYGFFIGRLFGLKGDVVTPAYALRDHLDFEPAPKWYLLGQHLSAIAAAGPIVGPVLAGMWFGWLPTVLWILFGGIFIGGLHDMASLIASVRHRGKSIAEIVRTTMGKRASLVFLVFLWFSLVYIITAFADITASTFIDGQRGPAVASSSLMYLGLAFVMGVIVRRFHLPLWVSTLVFSPGVFLCIWGGPFVPLSISPFFGLDLRMSWDMVLLGYCFVAAVIPVWLLLQPRGYLGGFFLTFTALVSFIGLVIGHFVEHTVIQYPAFTGWLNPSGLPLFPLLFTTVACGACSGFHAIVSSGTTSKQIAREPDVRLVGFGGMLLESFVAIIALSTLLLLNTHQAQALKDPNQIYAQGIAVFLHHLGIPQDFAINFALLAFATFVYDTLDVATRLGRYIFQEITGFKNRWGPYVATAATLVVPVFCLTQRITDSQGNVVPAWKAFWTIFGSSNQLLAAVVLLAVSVWMFKEKKKYLVALLPSVFMMLIAVISLLIILKPWLSGIFVEHRLAFDPMSITGIILLVLAVVLVSEGTGIFLKRRGAGK